jgi:hypothetical protein
MEIIKYNEIYNRQKNLLSLSIVKMKGPYREFDKYTRALDRLLDHTYNNTYGFDVRVYFDDSCHKEIESLINKYKNVEFFKFNYPPLRIGPYHDGTFGSLVRILPIFEEHPTYDKFKKIQEYQYDYVWIDDIDILPKNLNLNDINKEEIAGFNTYFLSIFCYYRPWIKPEHNYNMNFPLVTNIKLRMNIFTKFLDDLANNRFKDVIERILKFRPDRYKYDYPVRHPYGMDEYFTNYIIYDNLTKYNTYVLYQTEVTPLLKSISYTKEIDDKYKEILKSLLDLHYLSYKATDLKTITKINNTYIKLFNKLDKQKLYSILDEEKKICIKEYIDFLKKYDMKDINNFKYIIKIN